MFGWFKRKPVNPTGPHLLHRWHVDVCRWWKDGMTEIYQFEVTRSGWNPDPYGGWGATEVMGRFDTEQEARDFIDRYAHLPQAFDVTKSYETKA
jgi:hypothetical protein